MIRYKFSKFSTAIILALLAFAASVNAQQALDGGAPGDASVTSDASPAPTPQIAYRYDCSAAKAHRNNPIDSMSPITETAFANAAGSVRIPGPGITLLSPWDADAHSVTISRDNVRGGRNLSLAVNYRTPHGSLIVAEAEAPLGAHEVSVRYYLPRETFDQPVTVVSAKCTLVRTITASPRVTQPVAPLPPPLQRRRP